jgi:hypothetical protein
VAHLQGNCQWKEPLVFNASYPSHSICPYTPPLCLLRPLTSSFSGLLNRNYVQTVQDWAGSSARRSLSTRILAVLGSSLDGGIRCAHSVSAGQGSLAHPQEGARSTRYSRSSILLWLYAPSRRIGASKQSTGSSDTTSDIDGNAGLCARDREATQQTLKMATVCSYEKPVDFYRPAQRNTRGNRIHHSNCMSFIGANVTVLCGCTFLFGLPSLLT